MVSGIWRTLLVHHSQEKKERLFFDRPRALPRPSPATLRVSTSPTCGRGKMQTGREKINCLSCAILWTMYAECCQNPESSAPYVACPCQIPGQYSHILPVKMQIPCSPRAKSPSSPSSAFSSRSRNIWIVLNIKPQGPVFPLLCIIHTNTGPRHNPSIRHSVCLCNVKMRVCHKIAGILGK